MARRDEREEARVDSVAPHAPVEIAVTDRGEVPGTAEHDEQEPEPRPRPAWWDKAVARTGTVLSPRRYLIPVLLAVSMGLICIHNQFGGIEWGDDFALYVRQAKALTVGNIGEVLRENRFSVDNSGWHSFSPYSYPWGWPLLMAPVYVMFGLDYQVLKLLEVVAFCTFLVVFFALARRRVGLVPATILAVLFGVSRAFNGATDTVLSDLPYLCFAFVSLWLMDRYRESGQLLSDRRALIVLGLVLAFTWNVRREGIALVIALAALHVAILGGAAVREKSLRALGNINWRNVALPYVTFAGATVTFQLLLPGVFLPNLPGTGVANVSPHITYYKDVLAEHLGLKGPGSPMELFGSPAAALFAVRLFVVLAGVGLLLRLLRRLEEDVHLAAFLCASVVIMMVSPYQDSRYFFTITPLLAYFAYQALPTLAAIFTTGRPMAVRLASALPALALSGLVLLCWRELAHAIDYHRDYHYTIDGPEAPHAKQMFAAVKRLTRGDDVILFFRARAMTLYTDRSAIQGSDLDLLLPRSDWYVMAKNSDYSQTPLNDDQAAERRLTKAWENTRWVIWRVPPRA